MDQSLSNIIPKVKDLLEDFYLLTPQEYEIRASAKLFHIWGGTSLGLEVVVYIVRKNNFYLLCGWGEQMEGRHSYYPRCGIVTEERVLEKAKEEISSNERIKKHGNGPLYAERKKTLLLKEENKRLQEKIASLRQKNRELKYRPGNKGALKAEQHFSKYFA